MDRRGTPHLVHLTDAVPETRLLRLPNARGYRVVSLSGVLWVTEEHRTEDIILQPGDAVTLRSPGTALVTPLGSADIEIVPPPADSRWTDRPMNVERYGEEARRLRAAAFRDALVAIGRALRRAARRVALGARGAATDPWSRKTWPGSSSSK